MGEGVWKAAEKNPFYRHIFFCFPFCTDDSINSTDNAAPVIFIYFACANWVEMQYTLGALIIRLYGMKDTVR